MSEEEKPARDEGEGNENDEQDPLAFLSALRESETREGETSPQTVAGDADPVVSPTAETAEDLPSKTLLDRDTPPRLIPILVPEPGSPADTSAGAIFTPDPPAPPPQSTKQAPPLPALDTGDLPKVSPFVGDPLDVEEVQSERGPASSPKRDKGGKVQDAIRKLREKMATVATEYAEGKINQAQFEAIYARYQEQRQITESLLARDPKTEAWQQVLVEGPTSYLRSQHEARMEGYLLYLNRTGKPFMKRGEVRLDPQVMMESIKQLESARGDGTVPRARQVGGGHWLVYVPGRHTTAIGIYNNEPTSAQLALAGDLHRDFETANQRNLTSEQFSPNSLVFPQRALFEE